MLIWRYSATKVQDNQRHLLRAEYKQNQRWLAARKLKDRSTEDVEKITYEAGDLLEGWFKTKTPWKVALRQRPGQYKHSSDALRHAWNLLLTLNRERAIALRDSPGATIADDWWIEEEKKDENEEMEEDKDTRSGEGAEDEPQESEGGREEDDNGDEHDEDNDDDDGDNQGGVKLPHGKQDQPRGSFLLMGEVDLPIRERGQAHNPIHQTATSRQKLVFRKKL